jgi:Flp pilus assembly protein TadD
MQEYGGAEETFRKVVKLNSNDAVAFLGIGAPLNRRLQRRKKADSAQSGIESKLR